MRPEGFKFFTQNCFYIEVFKLINQPCAVGFYDKFVFIVAVNIKRVESAHQPVNILCRKFYKSQTSDTAVFFAALNCFVDFVKVNNLIACAAVEEDFKRIFRFVAEINIRTEFERIIQKFEEAHIVFFNEFPAFARLFNMVVVKINSVFFFKR